MKVKWTTLGMVVFLLLSVVMTCCFVWQYRMPKLRTGELLPPRSSCWIRAVYQELRGLHWMEIVAAGLAAEANSCWGGGAEEGEELRRRS